MDIIILRSSENYTYSELAARKAYIVLYIIVPKNLRSSEKYKTNEHHD